MAKVSTRRKKEQISTWQHIRRTWSRRSFSEKVMYVLSILIVLSMVMALFGSFASSAG